MSDFDADLDVLFDENLSLFGREVGFTPSGSDESTNITLIVTPGLQLEEIDPGIYLHAQGKVSDFPQSPVNGDVIEIDGNSYTIIQVGINADRVEIRLRRDT